ncbi:MAG TPA: c-type cytochrome biogenesis protein CcmI, partial [Gammaproteobacteria bacterium]|nr:c-type cytochrome biogenesis protein CcmI [Gammaproteobacteria bacterium]
MSFLIAAGLLLLAVLLLLGWPLLRRVRRSAPDDVHGRLVAELDDDVAAGVLPAEDRALAARDLEPVAKEELHSPRRSGRWAWLALAAVPLVAVVLYWQLGNWRAGIEGNRAAVLHEADQMLAELRVHLKSDPRDAAGWITLGRAESAMGNYPSAASAYGRAVQVDGSRDPELLAAWGEAQVLADPA